MFRFECFDIDYKMPKSNMLKYGEKKLNLETQTHTLNLCEKDSFYKVDNKIHLFWYIYIWHLYFIQLSRIYN